MSPSERSKHRRRMHKVPKDNRKSLVFPNSKYAAKLTRKRGDKLQKEVARLLRKVDHPMFKSTFRIIQLHIFYLTGVGFPLDELFKERKMLDVLPDDVNLDRWIYLKTAKNDVLAATLMNLAMMRKLSDLKISEARTHPTHLSTVIQKLWESSNSSNYNSSDHHSSSSSHCSDSLHYETNPVGDLKSDITCSTRHNEFGFGNYNLGFSSQIDTQRALQQYTFPDVLPVRHSHVLESFWPAQSSSSLSHLDDDDENPEHKLSLAERCKKLLGSLN